MSSFISRLSRFFSPKKIRAHFQKAIRAFSRRELASFLSLAAVATLCVIWLLIIVSNRESTIVPVSGGTLHEGIIGTPRFVNPVLAVSDADKDLSALVYSGLMRLDKNGMPIPDLAASYTVSPDGKVYTFDLRTDIFFQDKKPVTADDVVYTVNQIENPLLQSPKRSAWSGITVKKASETSVTFELSQPFSPFLELATVGILPEHLWAELSPEEFSFSSLNITAIGSGPYKIKSVNRNAAGIADEFILLRNPRFNLGKPYLKKIYIHSFANERDLSDALLSGSIEVASGLSPEKAADLRDKGMAISTQVLPRVIGLFMNKGANPIFADGAVVDAVKAALNKKVIIDTVLDGYGEPIDGPVPAIFMHMTEVMAEDTPVKNAGDILDAAGWHRNEGGTRTKDGKTLSFSIATADTPELSNVLGIMKEELEVVGFQVEEKIFGLGDLNQEVIRPRAFDALLFGEFVTSSGSLYSFWHSGETNDPGLNVASWKSSTTDKALATMIAATDTPTIVDSLKKINDDIKNSASVAFLYSPLYLEARRAGFKERETDDPLIMPGDRFRNVYEWYLDTERVWNVFLKN